MVTMSDGSDSETLSLTINMITIHSLPIHPINKQKERIEEAH